MTTKLAEPMVARTRKQLGELLLEQGLVTEEQLRQALLERKPGEFLGEALVRLDILRENTLIPVLAKQLHLAPISLKNYQVDPEAVRKVSVRLATHYCCMPLTLTNGTLQVAMADPQNVETLDELRLLLRCDIKPLLAGPSDIREALQRHYGVGASALESMGEQQEVPEYTLPSTSTVELEDPRDEASIVQFVNQLLLQAYRDHVTDIHVEPYEDQLRVRFRIDGVLRETKLPASVQRYQSAIISRLKIMAQLDIAERRLPQDGRVKVLVGGDALDLRVSFLPTPYGESIVLRLLSQGMLHSLEQLGFDQRDLNVLEQLIQKPHGIMFVTGPTGSGKTTTLYACLNKINTTDRKIITIEDPIEYRLKGITQIQVHPKIELSFARGLRSILRHDPDVIMVGEVRDSETAEITIRSALTGHLVFSTLHTNDAAGGITRLIDMGVEPFLLASSVECFIAQRLVRVICPECRGPMPQTAEFLALAQAIGITPEQCPTLVMGRGCEACNQTGFRGRRAIYEFLLVNEPIRALIMQRASSVEIARKAIEQGMRSLRQDGCEKVLLGVTTPSEVLRVTQENPA